MFSIRVHLPNVEGHQMHECVDYAVKPVSNGVLMVLTKRDGTKQNLSIQSGGCAYVMNGVGKTVDTVRPSGAKQAVLRGGGA